MKLLHFVKKMINDHPILFSYPDFYSSQIRVLDHIFGTIGNGLEWAYTKSENKGGYLCDAFYNETSGENSRRLYDAPYGKDVYDAPVKLKHSPCVCYKGDSHNFFNWYPYPSFDKEFCLLWETDFIQEDWKVGALLWLSECRNYFAKGSITLYPDYPLSNGHITSLKNFIESKMEKGSTVDEIRKSYESTVFNGNNFVELAWERWVKEYKKISSFIEDTTNRVLSL